MLRCPWHGACFSAATGDIEDFPGLDSLATHQVCSFSYYMNLLRVSTLVVQVEEVEGQVVIKADKRDLLRGRRAPAVLQVSGNIQLPVVLSDPGFWIPQAFMDCQCTQILCCKLLPILLSEVEVNEEEEGMVVIGGGAAGHTAVETLRYTNLFKDALVLGILRVFNLQERGFQGPNLTSLQGASPSLR